jgi:hypothetical protein
MPRRSRLAGTEGRSLKATLNVFAHRLAIDIRFSGNGRHRQPLLMQIQDHDCLSQLDYQNAPFRPSEGVSAMTGGSSNWRRFKRHYWGVLLPPALEDVTIK